MKGKHPGAAVVRLREYVGSFNQGTSKHSLEVDIRTDGQTCLKLNYATIDGNQMFYAIMLSQELRQDLGKFLLDKRNDFEWIVHHNDIDENEVED